MDLFKVSSGANQPITRTSQVGHGFKRQLNSFAGDALVGKYSLFGDETEVDVVGNGTLTRF